MGHRHSRPIVPHYGAVQQPFQPIGCSGFTEYDYKTANRLEQAPFLYYKVISKNYEDLKKQIQAILKDLPDPDIYNNPIPAHASGSGSLDALANVNNMQNLQTVGNTVKGVVGGIEFFVSARNIPIPKAKPPPPPPKPPVSVSSPLLPGVIPAQTADNMFNSVHDKPIAAGSHKFVQNGTVYGPVFVLSAYDMENQNIESWLFFPSMTKDRQKYPDLWFLANSNKWIFRIIYSVIYKYKPFSSCQIHQRVPTDKGVRWELDDSYRWTNAINSNYIYGCKSDSKYFCRQSDGVHQAMGIYDQNKNENAYPTTYFRSYQLDSTEPSISQYFSPNTFNTLLMCFLQSDFEMFAGCRYMLVSPNRRFFYILESDRLILYYNLVPTLDILSLCHNGVNPRTHAIKVRIVNFKGLINTKMVIENGLLNIYSQATSKDPSTLIWSLSIVKNGYTGPCTLILLDDGSLKVFDNGTNDISSDNLNSLKSTLNDQDTIGQYNYMTDYKMRLIQLTAYLKLNNMLKGGILTADDYLNFGKSSFVSSGTEYNQTYDEMALFDSNIDYVKRITDLIDRFIREGKMTYDEKNEYLMKLLNIQAAEKAYSENAAHDAKAKNNLETDDNIFRSNDDQIQAATDYLSQDQDSSNGSGYTGGVKPILDDGYGTGSSYYNPDGNGQNKLNSPDPYPPAAYAGIPSGGSVQTNPAAEAALDAYFSDSKNKSDIQAKTVKDKADAKDKSDSNKEQIEDTMISGKSSAAASMICGYGSGSGSGSGSYTCISNPIDAQTAQISNILGFGIDGESVGSGSMAYASYNKSYAIGYNPDLPDMYNDELTPEEVGYLFSNGMFENVLDVDIRMKKLHQFLKKSGKKLYMPTN